MDTTQDARLAALGDEYFRARNEHDPFGATVFGVTGYDAEVPDPSRAAADRAANRLGGIAAKVAEIDPATLGETDRVSHAWLTRVLADEQEVLRGGLDEVAVNASIAGVVPLLVGTIPTASVADPAGAEAYLARLERLGGFLDALGHRHVEALADGRTPTRLGVEQAVAQLDAYLSSDLESDPLISPRPGADVDGTRWLARAEDLVRGTVRPALTRYRELLADRLLPAGRGDDEVGVGGLPGGEAAYLGLVRAHTTTELTPAEIHETGVRLVARLREEFSERGAKVLGTSDPDEVIARLRDDPALRFETSAQIVDTVTGALRRAEEALPDWFRDYSLAPCVVREMDAAEAENSVLGYYQPPTGDGTRPGAHVINTLHPQTRTRFEYEALAFHESVPGHHLQIALAQAQRELPEFRRYTYITAHGEGWGLYAERLSDRMGLYSDDTTRLGMVSFDAWRACRLVVDTGMHQFGWSRQRAIDYMRDNTALSMSNITNEVDRYIAVPGQALAYMIGKLRIEELGERMRAARGASFDIRDFHHAVLGHGPLPLSTLEEVVTLGS
ncbi:DUF885 domain-containing protein [Hamadaea sp. NPDC050747]|uniref:DUF885 domain-containing protein n=1 Tax=Hamadaea sp. NPDC050747 TaxID=3155789 RepID=UPI0033D1B3AD